MIRPEVAAKVKWQGVVGTSAAMQDVLRQVENAARTNTTVLITGENGTGKELIARTLHRSGKRAIASREVTPLGGSRAIPVDVRIIAATNRDLRRRVQEGQFREDLANRVEFRQ